MVLILHGVDKKLDSALLVNEFGVEHKASLCAPSAWPPPLDGLKTGNPGQQQGVDRKEGVDACPCNANGVATL